MTQHNVPSHLLLRKQDLVFFYHKKGTAAGMDWINCNLCCRQPGDDRERTFTLSSCGHIFCDLCLARAKYLKDFTLQPRRRYLRGVEEQGGHVACAPLPDLPPSLETSHQTLRQQSIESPGSPVVAGGRSPCAVLSTTPSPEDHWHNPLGPCSLKCAQRRGSASQTEA
ncbi:hypothetical protein E2C01_017917 [Portunus trituberculatus]|uniref:RING-type domain-containing protein n=1 Tax=Portunus trituberculatus TaxID=210409 RepID=A0A5B7DT52_PORTR|nr:hypothetical protein [Portunus trituberculatus]